MRAHFSPSKYRHKRFSATHCGGQETEETCVCTAIYDSRSAVMAANILHFNFINKTYRSPPSDMQSAAGHHQPENDGRKYVLLNAKIWQEPERSLQRHSVVSLHNMRFICQARKPEPICILVAMVNLFRRVPPHSSFLRRRSLEEHL